MTIAFDQYQRYKNVQLIIESIRKNNQTFHILEVGANEHQNLEKFLPFDEITYLDINLPNELLNNPKYILGDATQMDFPDNSFDIIVALDVYEHIFNNSKENFVKELKRVSSYMFIICAPFYSEAVEDAEKRLNQVFKTIHNIDHIWLSEHIGNGLPHFDQLLDFLDAQNCEYEYFGHGNLELWERLTNIHFFSVFDSELVNYTDYIDKYYNENLFVSDYGENTYRKFIVGKQKMFSLDIPKESDYFQKISPIKYFEEIFYKLFDNKNIFALEKKLDYMSTDIAESNQYFAQIYFNNGNGFTESESIIKEFQANQGEKVFLEIEIVDFLKDTNQIRIDPINFKCMTQLRDIRLIDMQGQCIHVLDNKYETNAVYHDENNIFKFDTDDSNIVLNLNQFNLKHIILEYSFILINPIQIEVFQNIMISHNDLRYQYLECMENNKIKDLSLENKDEELRNKDEEIKNKDEELRNKDEELRDKDEELRDKDKELRDKDEELRNKSEELSNKDEEIKNKDEEIKNKDEELNYSFNEIKVKTEEIESFKTELIGLEDELCHYKTHYFAAIAQREELKEKLAYAEYKYMQISTSTAWKLTRPLRKTTDVAKKIIRSNKLTYLSFKGMKCLKENGINYTLDKVTFKLKNQNDVKMLSKQSLYTKEEIEEQKNKKFDLNIKFSVVVPLFNTPENFLREMIESVQAQTYANWELCLADGSDETHESVGQIVKKYEKKDGRIKYKKLKENLGISENTNACLEMTTGEYVGLLDHDDLLHQSVLYEVMMAITEKNADFIYTDETTFHNVPEDAFCPHFKPDFAIDTLRANNYICHFTVCKKSLMDEVGYYRKECDGSQDFDMVLRLTEKAEKIVHIQKILYYWRAHSNSVASEIGAKPYVISAAKKAVADHLKRLGIKGEVVNSSVISTYKINYEIIGQPFISIIIANKDHIIDLKKCIDSIIEKSTYCNYEIIIVENNSVETNIFEYYKELENTNSHIRVVYWPDAFNYSAINNFGVTFAKGDHILLLNNDIEVITPNWLEEMLMYSQRPDIGAVGAMLYYPDDTVQHAGVGIGILSLAGHYHRHFHRGHPGYMARMSYAQNLSAVTAACMMMSKKVFDEINGFDESFEVAFNDIDLCMRIRKAGYLIAWTPYAELYHYESKSRGYEDTAEKQKRFKGEVSRFQKRWSEELKAGDPYYNPNFSLDKEDFSFK